MRGIGAWTSMPVMACSTQSRGIVCNELITENWDEFLRVATRREQKPTSSEALLALVSSAFLKLATMFCNAD
jgi:hypothetical protein